MIPSNPVQIQNPLVESRISEIKKRTDLRNTTHLRQRDKYVRIFEVSKNER